MSLLLGSISLSYLENTLTDEPLDQQANMAVNVPAASQVHSGVAKVDDSFSSIGTVNVSNAYKLFINTHESESVILSLDGGNTEHIIVGPEEFCFLFTTNDMVVKTTSGDIFLHFRVFKK